jgi:hypothetical protein
MGHLHETLNSLGVLGTMDVHGKTFYLYRLKMEVFRIKIAYFFASYFWMDCRVNGTVSPLA